MSDDLQRDLDRAKRAEVLLNDDLLSEAFEQLKKTYFEQAWENPSGRALDTAFREKLWQAYQIVGLVQSHLHTVLASGDLAANELQKITQVGERRKIFGVI